MTQKIAFRAWHNEDKYMITSERSIYTVLQHVLNVGVGSGFSDVDTTPKPNRYEIMQYIGLNDKHGKEIFKGDIVKDSDTLFVVEFGESEFLEYTGWGWILKSNKSTFQISQACCKVIEIIGNIYENPEMAKPITTL